LSGQPTKIGKYEILNTIGRGGMGVVYKARDPRLDRLVAIKMIIGANPALLKRFDVEARSTASLQHQNIVTIYDFGNQDGNPYLVMEYLEGMSLESIISSERSLSLANKLNICIGICNGLSYAHERGIIHRDIKPANVMLLNDDNVKIVDFGIARIGDTGISRTEVVGSLHYMSPEQFQSTPLDTRTDIFSTGVVLYRLLTGALPFQAAGEAAVMYQIINEAPLPIASRVQGYPGELDAIVAKALAKNRESRYPSCRDLAFDLQVVQDQQKHTEVLEWLQRAEAAVQRTEWTKAEDYLKQLLKIEKHHTRAHQMLGEVQDRVRRQRRADQSRHLRSQADEAFLDHRYDDALAILAQAIGLDSTNPDLLSLRETIQEAKARAARLHIALRRAEGAQQAGDLDEAKRAISEALELEPEETSVKVLRHVIFKQVEERDRQQKLRNLLDHARDQLAARDLTNALETLKAAEIIDSASVELRSLLKVANTARAQQMRKAELEKLSRLIEEALAREDYAAASTIASEGLQRYPQEQGLLKLKALSDAEQTRIRLIAYAKDQFVVANGLLEAGKTLAALSVIENALQKVPGDVHLDSLRAVIKDRLTSEEAEERKRKLLQSAADSASAREYDDAVRILEDARREFSGTKEIELLLQRVRAAQTKEMSVVEAMASAQQMLQQGNPDSAVQFLEAKIPELSDARLSTLLEDARRQKDQFQRGLRSAMEQAQRILQDHGAVETAKYLEIQPERYRETPEFRSFADSVVKRMAVATLDHDLALQTEPDAQLRLAEAALRKNPENKEIKDRLASVLARKEQMSALVDRAHSFESSGQYADAIEQLSALRKLHSKFPGLENEIRRLQRLEEQRKDLAAKQARRIEIPEPPQAAPNVVQDAPVASNADEKEVGATRIIGSTRSDEAVITSAVRPAAVSWPEVDSPPAALIAQQTVQLNRQPSRTWLAVALTIVIAVAGVVAYRMVTRPTTIAVSILPTPADSAVIVDGRSCPNPCRLNLPIGPHEVQASHGDYVAHTELIHVEQGVTPDFSFSLSPLETPPSLAMGTLIIHANVEDASVLVDGSIAGSVGKNKQFSASVAPGKHKIVVQKQGFESIPAASNVEVSQSHEVDVSFELLEKVAGVHALPEQYLTFEGPPTGAEVLIDSHAYQLPASRRLDVPVQAGLRHVEVNAKGFERWTKDVKVESGVREEVTAEMKPTSPPARPAESSTPAPLPPPAPLPSGSFAVDRTVIEKGEKAELSWNIQNASSVRIDGQAVSASGSKTVSPTESTTTYHLVATAPGGKEIEKEAVVIVNTPAPAKPTIDASAVSPQDKQAISDLLAQYAASFEHKDAKKLQELWPGIGKDLLKKIKTAYGANTRVSFSSLSFSRLADGKVQVSCTQSVQSDQMKVPSAKTNFSILVNQKGGSWVINFIPLNE
jgi:tRNA A-37 threonylcarbamoyl transferase component Bud32/tetratricopeptide (TPR) repeat protein